MTNYMSNNKKVDKLILIIGVMAIILSVLVLYISKKAYPYLFQIHIYQLSKINKDCS